MTAAEKFEKALAAFDRIHEQDPKRVDHQGVQIASGQLYARRMLDSLLRCG